MQQLQCLKPPGYLFNIQYIQITKTQIIIRTKHNKKNVPSIIALMITDFEMILISTVYIFPVMHCSWHFTI